MLEISTADKSPLAGDYLQPVLRIIHALLFAVKSQVVKDLDLRVYGMLIVEDSCLVMVNFGTQLTP